MKRKMYMVYCVMFLVCLVIAAIPVTSTSTESEQTESNRYYIIGLIDSWNGMDSFRCVNVKLITIEGGHISYQHLSGGAYLGFGGYSFKGLLIPLFVYIFGYALYYIRGSFQ